MGYRQLSTGERAELFALLEQEGMTLRQAGRLMGRSASTLSRELSRNGEGGKYRAEAASECAAQRRAKRRGVRKLKPGTVLWGLVEQRLQVGWSPEQISRRLKLQAEYPNVSHETIYKAIYALPKGELKKDLISTLRQAHRTRRPRSGGAKRGETLKAITPISARPADVEHRAIPGHWEADLIKGQRNRSAVATLVERTTRFTILAKLPDAKASSVLAALTEAMGTLPKEMLRSLTYDRGSEMALHQTLSARLEIPIFFADPYAPWQRGTCENTNGLIRQYLPKGTDLSIHSQDDLNQVAHALNMRPRAALGYHTPVEAFTAIMKAHPSTWGIALSH